MDDPIAASKGTQEEVDIHFLALFLLWEALGLKVSYPKVSRGCDIDWIGARLQVDTASRTITVTLPSKKFQELAEKLKELQSSGLAAGVVKTDPLRRLAGLGSWIGGLNPQIRPFVQMYWAALTKSREGKVFWPQIRIPVEWLLQLATAQQADFTRIIHVIRLGGGHCINN